jgi:hypothetical protein
MSAAVKTPTPFLSKKILLNALDSLNVKYQIINDVIQTDRQDYYGNQSFIWNGERYLFQHDSGADSVYSSWQKTNTKEWKTVTQFLSAVGNAYNLAYQQHIEELERMRLEEKKKQLEKERKAYIEKQRQSVIAKAKSQGYGVKEKQKNGRIQLVLVRHI